MAILEMKHISKAFSGVYANEDIDLSVEKGEIHALLGENGAGDVYKRQVENRRFPFLIITAAERKKSSKPKIDLLLCVPLHSGRDSVVN